MREESRNGKREERGKVRNGLGLFERSNVFDGILRKVEDGKTLRLLFT